MASADDKQRRHEANRERFVTQCCYMMKLAPYGFDVCPVCKGEGRDGKSVCFMCLGEGKIRSKR